VLFRSPRLYASVFLRLVSVIPVTPSERGRGLTRSGACPYAVPVHTTTEDTVTPALAEILAPDSDHAEWLIEAPRARELERYLAMVGAARKSPTEWKFKNISLSWSKAPIGSRVPLLLKVRRG